MAESCRVTILQYQVSVLYMDREFAADEPPVYGDISQQHLPQTHCVQPLESVYEYPRQRSVAQLFAAAHSGLMYLAHIIYIVLNNIKTKLIADEGLNNFRHDIINLV